MRLRIVRFKPDVMHYDTILRAKEWTESLGGEWVVLGREIHKYGIRWP